MAMNPRGRALCDIIGPPQLRRDGREAYFSRRTTEGDIWLVTLSPSKPLQ
jgi:hypothetical protein